MFRSCNRTVQGSYAVSTCHISPVKKHAMQWAVCMLRQPSLTHLVFYVLIGAFQNDSPVSMYRYVYAYT